MRQEGDAASDSGASVHLDDPGKGCGKLLRKEREVGAGKNHHVHAPALERGNGRRHGCCRNGLSPKLRLGERDEFGRPMAKNGAIGGEPRGKVVHIGLPDSGRSAEHAYHPAPRPFGRRLDRRNGADHRDIERCPDEGEGDGGGRVARDDRNAGTKAFGQPAEKGGNAGRNLRFGARAVRKGGTVRGVDDGCIRQQLPCRPEHGQTSDARVEEQNGSFGVHAERFLGSLRAGAMLTSLCAMSPEPFYALALGYLFGSVPFGLLLTRLTGKGDIRAIGSGNIGATNVLRTGSKGLAAATLVLDALKGTAAVLIADQIWPGSARFAAAGALVGHLYPVWLRFRGGKGVATFLGILIALSWEVASIYAAVWIGLLLILRISSVAGMCAAVSAPVAAALLSRPDLVPMLAAFALLVLWQHRANIARLKEGTEPRIGRSRA